MRTLTVIGVTSDGRRLICADASTQAPVDDSSDASQHGGHDHAEHAARFTLPIDERLRAAVKGDSRQFGQLEITMTPQLSPKEIQRRIRAGATVDEVAAAAACDPTRIDRFAYPILLERSTAAERARHVCPLQDATIGTESAAAAQSTLDDIVTATLADRGQDKAMQWDAFKDERGWTLSLTWQAGRTENRAEWAFTPRPHGGSVSPRDHHARELVEPGPLQLRTIGGEPHAGGAGRAEGADGPDDNGDDVIPERAGSDEPRLTAQEYEVASTVTDQRSATPITRRGGDGSGSSSARRSGRRKARPPMPSWEDVLLGTRTADQR